jgi:polyisoprenoid-binding protein YceI
MTGTRPGSSGNPSSIVQAGRWQLRATSSSATFAVGNFGGMRTVHGQVPIRHAWVDVDDTGRPLTVHAELDLVGIDTGNNRRDTDLRKPRLLDTEKFPTLTFVGGPGKSGTEGWSVPGTIAAHGAETAVVVTAVVADEPGSDDVTISATAQFDRRALGVKAPRFLIGTQVGVSIQAVFTPAG